MPQPDRDELRSRVPFTCCIPGCTEHAPFGEIVGPVGARRDRLYCVKHARERWGALPRAATAPVPDERPRVIPDWPWDGKLP